MIPMPSAASPASSRALCQRLGSSWSISRAGSALQRARYQPKLRHPAAATSAGLSAVEEVLFEGKGPLLLAATPHRKRSIPVQIVSVIEDKIALAALINCSWESKSRHRWRYLPRRSRP
jgi:hypothetical protein